jgi:hypothetical protein
MTALVAEGRESGSRRERVTAPVLVAGAVLGASVVLHLRDPHQTGSYLFCPWFVITGTYCPGCGGLRAVNDLTRGDLAAAASSNLLLAGAVPLLLFMWSRWFLDRWRGVRRVVDQRRGVLWASLFGLVSLLYWVVRNLPGLEWLAP